MLSFGHNAEIRHSEVRAKFTMEALVSDLFRHLRRLLGCAGKLPQDHVA